MTHKRTISARVPRLAVVIAIGGMAALLSGCVVAPVGYAGYEAYPAASVYVAPAPVVVAPGYYRGYGPYGRHHGYGGYRGRGFWR